ncbi:hypothetical protein AB1Y20_020443 [Prymnesium parvum]|uniref:WW domain-containing protein n=1 Tax=Prymnesium parvum TaxID=97485 RepID=A0AB34JV40_PRYPA
MEDEPTLVTHSSFGGALSDPPSASASPSHMACHGDSLTRPGGEMEHEHPPGTAGTAGAARDDDYDSLSQPLSWTVVEVEGKACSLKTARAGLASVVGARPTVDVLRQLRLTHAELTGKRHANEYRRSLHACAEWMEPRGVHEVTFEVRRAASRLGVCVGVLGGGGKAKHSQLHAVWGVNATTGELVYTPRLSHLDPQAQPHAPRFAADGLAEPGSLIEMRVNFKRKSLSFRANHGPWWEARFPKSVAALAADAPGLRPWAHLRPAPEATRPGDSVMLVSYLSARAVQERCRAALQQAVGAVEAQLARCHAAAASSSAAAEVRKLSSCLPSLGEALEMRDALFDAELASLAPRALRLHEEAHRLQQAEQRLVAAMAAPLESEVALGALEAAVAVAEAAGVVEEATLAQARHAVRQERERRADVARGALASALEAPLPSVDVAALQKVVAAAEAAGVGEVSGAKEKLRAALQLAGARQRLRRAMEAVRQGAAQGVAQLEAAVEEAKACGAGEEEVRGAASVLEQDASRRAAIERLRVCSEPELEHHIDAALQRLEQESHNPPAIDEALRTGVPEAEVGAAVRKLQLATAQRGWMEEIARLVAHEAEALDAPRLRDLLARTEGLRVAHRPSDGACSWRAQCHALRQQAAEKLEEAALVQALAAKLAGGVRKLRKRLDGALGTSLEAVSALECGRLEATLREAEGAGLVAGVGEARALLAAAGEAAGAAAAVVRAAQDVRLMLNPAGALVEAGLEPLIGALEAAARIFPSAAGARLLAEPQQVLREARKKLVAWRKVEVARELKEKGRPGATELLEQAVRLAEEAGITDEAMEHAVRQMRVAQKGKLAVGELEAAVGASDVDRLGKAIRAAEAAYKEAGGGGGWEDGWGEQLGKARVALAALEAERSQAWEALVRAFRRPLVQIHVKELEAAIERAERTHMDRQIVTDAKKRLAARKRLGALAEQHAEAAAQGEPARPLEEVLDELQACLSDSDLQRLIPERLKHPGVLREAAPSKEVERLVRLQLCRPSAQTAWGLRLSEANLVESIVAGSPAASGGVCEGDVVVAVEGAPLGEGPGAAVQAIRQHGQRAELSLTLRRKGGETGSAERREVAVCVGAPHGASHSGGLPAGWSEFTDRETRQPYYFHAPTQTTTWAHPMLEAAAAPHAKVEALQEELEGVHALNADLRAIIEQFYSDAEAASLVGAPPAAGDAREELRRHLAALTADANEAPDALGVRELGRALRDARDAALDADAMAAAAAALARARRALGLERRLARASRGGGEAAGGAVDVAALEGALREATEWMAREEAPPAPLAAAVRVARGALEEATRRREGAAAELAAAVEEAQRGGGESVGALREAIKRARGAAVEAEDVARAEGQLEALEAARGACDALAAAVEAADGAQLQAAIDGGAAVLQRCGGGGGELRQTLGRAREVLKQQQKDAAALEQSYLRAMKLPLAAEGARLQLDLAQLQATAEVCEARKLEPRKLEQLWARLAARKDVAAALREVEAMAAGELAGDAFEAAVARLLEALQAPHVPPEQPSAAALRRRYERRLEAARRREAQEEARRRKAREACAAPVVKRIGEQLRKEDASVCVSRLRRSVEDARAQGIDEETVIYAEEKVRRLERERSEADAQLEAALRKRGEARDANEDLEFLQHAVVALQRAKEVGSELCSTSKAAVADWQKANKALRAREVQELKARRAQEAREQYRELRTLRRSRRRFSFM